MQKKNGLTLLWYRQDLRIHDHPALQAALQKGEKVLAVYVISPLWNAATYVGGFPRLGPYRAHFLWEALTDLRKQWESRGGNLLIVRGKAEDCIPALCKTHNIQDVYCSTLYGTEELTEEGAVEAALMKQGAYLHSLEGHTLYSKEHLPFHLAKLPDIFTEFRKSVERYAQVADCLATPDQLPSAEIEDWGTMPNLRELVGQGHNSQYFPTSEEWKSTQAATKRVLKFKGGETAGLERLKHYLWDTDLIANYKVTRNGLLGGDYSSKFSAWLAMGCLSPRMIYQEVKRYEKHRIANDSTYWLVFELLWRDYFQFVAKKYGSSLYQPGGIKGQGYRHRPNPDLLHRWIMGQTGVPFVDANMRELRLTGFMSNRGRQNVASYWVKDLKQDWRLAAAWFESCLLDYDPCANYGNWNYVAGIGNDPREDRYFNIQKQARQYDPEAKYITRWLPELEPLPAAMRFEPYANEIECLSMGVKLGVDYPYPIPLMQRQELSQPKSRRG